MFDEYDYDYDGLVEDCDDLELYDDEYDVWDIDDIESETEWENYYHNLTEDIE